MEFYAKIKFMKIAKLIYGAKNTDIEKLGEFVKVYALAGADIFDVCADEEIISYVRKILNSLKLVNNPQICASITLQNDIHANKVRVNSEKCNLCMKCMDICPQGVIKFDKNINILEKGCVGCKLCVKACPNSALQIYFEESNFLEQYKNAKTADYIEIHTNGHDDDLFFVFEFLKENFTGKIGICISNNNNVSEKIEIIEKVKAIIAPETLIVQADGNSISGLNNDNITTQKAIAECGNFKNIDNIILIASGGTNECTFKIASDQNIYMDGVAWGSYARKILVSFTSDNERLAQAKQLINSVK